MTDLSPDILTRLTHYRQQIDSLDNELISLLKKRIGIVHEVGNMKRRDTQLRCFIRSGREATMVKRLYQEFLNSSFHPEAAAGIWRLIISASIHYEAPLTLAMADHSLTMTAANYFGHFVPQRQCNTGAEAIHHALAHHDTIAILAPDSTEWWQAMIKPEASGLKIFALLPFLPTMVTDTPSAYAAAQLLPEPTGDDTSLFLIDFADKAPELLKLEGYHTLESPQIAKLRLEHSVSIRHIHWLGAYANPISG